MGHSQSVQSRITIYIGGFRFKVSSYVHTLDGTGRFMMSAAPKGGNLRHVTIESHG